MLLQNKIKQMSKIKRMIFLALLLSMALVLSYFERLIPVPVAIPGVKLGLANIITLVSLYLFGFSETFTLIILRIFMNGIFTGNFISFWYSFSGGLLSFIIMYICIRWFSKIISTVGISILGAVSHNIGQLIVVAAVTKSIQVAISYFPILAVSGVVTGLFIGFTANFLRNHMEKITI